MPGRVSRIGQWDELKMTDSKANIKPMSQSAQLIAKKTALVREKIALEQKKATMTSQAQTVQTARKRGRPLKKDKMSKIQGIQDEKKALLVMYAKMDEKIAAIYAEDSQTGTETEAERGESEYDPAPSGGYGTEEEYRTSMESIREAGMLEAKMKEAKMKEAKMKEAKMQETLLGTKTQESLSSPDERDSKKPKIRVARKRGGTIPLPDSDEEEEANVSQQAANKRKTRSSTNSQPSVVVLDEEEAKNDDDGAGSQKSTDSGWVMGPKRARETRANEMRLMDKLGNRNTGDLMAEAEAGIQKIREVVSRSKNLHGCSQKQIMSAIETFHVTSSLLYLRASQQQEKDKQGELEKLRTELKLINLEKSHQQKEIEELKTEIKKIRTQMKIRHSILEMEADDPPLQI